MFGFGQLIEVLKKSPKKIVFTEGSDPRILEASSRLLASNFLHPILVGDPDEIEKAAEESGFNIRGAEIVDPKKFDRMDEMVDLFCELRKSKGVTPEQARGILSQANYFGTMLVKMGIADALLGGATYSTADTVRPALQLIKTKPGNSIVSSCFILVRPSATGENEVLAMSDCAIYIIPIGATLGAISWFYVMKKDDLLDAVNTGSRRHRGAVWYSVGRYVYVPLALVLCCVALFMNVSF